jgi:hypothetical protein
MNIYQNAKTGIITPDAEQAARSDKDDRCPMCGEFRAIKREI